LASSSDNNTSDLKISHIRAVTSTVEQEIEAMKKLRNIYIVTLYGISQNPATDEILMVTELMENGDLKSWLKPSPNLPEYSTLLRFSKDISSGMTYLEFRNYIHHDLACRNILLGPHDNFVKTAEFELPTIVYSIISYLLYHQSQSLKWVQALVNILFILLLIFHSLLFNHRILIQYI
jgi:serine/threonine protein kinase